MRAYVYELQRAMKSLPHPGDYPVGRLLEVSVVPIHEIAWSVGPEDPKTAMVSRRALFRVEVVGFGQQKKKVWALVYWPEGEAK